MTENLIPQRITDAVERVAKNEGHVAPEIAIQSLQVSNCFNSKIYSAHVKSSSANNTKSLHLFIKSIFSETCESTIVNEDLLFDTELYFYGELSKIMETLETEAKIPEQDKYQVIQYFNVDQRGLLILNDMTKQNFKTIKMSNIVSLKFAERAIENLAKFHSFSFALKKRRPEYFYSRLSHRTKFIFNKEYGSYLSNMAKKAEEVLVSEDYKVKFRKFSQNLFSKFEEMLKLENSKMVVLNHGDFRAGNILYREQDDGDIEQIVIDYQNLNYGSPMLDLFYFFMCDTDTEFRKNYMYHLRDHYYECLGKRLQYFNISIEEAYPRKDYEEDFNAKLPLAIFYGIQVLPFLLAKEDDVPDLSKTKLCDMSISTSTEYDRRVRLLIEEAVEWGVM